MIDPAFLVVAPFLSAASFLFGYLVPEYVVSEFNARIETIRRDEAR